MKLIDLLLKLEDLFDIEIKNKNNDKIYSGNVGSMPLNIIKDYGIYSNYIVEEILTSPKSDMVIYIKEVK